MDILKQYYYLVKPGIVRSNVMTAIAGFLFAAKGTIDWWLLLALVIGNTFVIAAGCVFNNYIDRDIDAKMARTQKRALVTGKISTTQALLYGTILGAVDFTVLALYTNWITVAVGIVAIVDYVILYGWAKRNTVHSTLIGGISGATSIVAGYTAVTGRIDTAAILLFLVMTFWQVPHFYAIGLFRYKDYKKAKLPVYPVIKGIKRTIVQSQWYIVGFIAAVTLLFVFKYTGWTYFIVMGAISLWWLHAATNDNAVKDEQKWARSVFSKSLVVLVVFSIMLAINKWVP